jgi:hypothetical protein
MTRFPKRQVIWLAAILFLLSVLATLGVGFKTPSVNKTEIPSNQSKPEPPPPSQEQPKAERLSPYDIESLIENDPQADLRDMWNGLGITGDTDADNYHLNILHTCHNCKSEMYAYDLDGKPGKEILLRVEDRPAEACRYLIFKQVKGRHSDDDWKLLGHIDHDFGRYSMPEHAFIVSSGHTWLLIEFQGGSGSGYSYYANGLFRVTADEVKAVLDFPSEGCLSLDNALPTSAFSSRILNCQEKGGRTTVEVELAISYQYPLADSDDSGDTLWSKNQRAVYTTQAATGKLVLDPVQSTVSEEELAEVYD